MLWKVVIPVNRGVTYCITGKRESMANIAKYSVNTVTHAQNGLDIYLSRLRSAL